MVCLSIALCLLFIASFLFLLVHLLTVVLGVVDFLICFLGFRLPFLVALRMLWRGWRDFVLDFRACSLNAVGLLFWFVWFVLQLGWFWGLGY